MMRGKIIAVDYDGTLEQNGAPNMRLISFLKRQQACGVTVILWTRRGGQRLNDALVKLRKSGFAPNYVNQNAPGAIAALGHDPRKIYADLYIDDKATN